MFDHMFIRERKKGAMAEKEEEKEEKEEKEAGQPSGSVQQKEGPTPSGTRT